MHVRSSRHLLLLTVVAVIVYVLGAELFQYLHGARARPRRRIVLPSEIHDKWIVMTSSMPSKDDVIRLIPSPDWKVVVVTRSFLQVDWRHPNVTILQTKEEEALDVRTTRNLPSSSHARKNLGYLYAISHGARLILDTDVGIRPTDHLHHLTSLTKEIEQGLMFAGRELFNPYDHFGQASLWPRGFPVKAVGGRRCHDYLLGPWGSPSVQQGLVDGGPDVDALLRLTRKESEENLDVTFDPAAPPVIVPPGVFAPFNAQNTLFRYDALWALLLPQSVTSRVSDIWRGYWAERLMWEIAGTVAFYPATARRVSDTRSYRADLEEESDLYDKTEDLLIFLRAWNCHESLTFFQCLVQLTTDLSGAGFLQPQDIDLAKAWVADLKDVGYQEPERVFLSVKKPSAADVFAQPGPLYSAPFDLTRHVTRVRFQATPQRPPLPHTGQGHSLAAAERMRQFENVLLLCPDHTMELRPKIMQNMSRSIMSDVLLVVEFNFPDFYHLIRHLETLHRAYFPNILYCGDNWRNFKAAEKTISVPVSFVEANVTKGYFGHECLVHAMRMHYDVKGFLHLSEDVLLNTWNLKDFSRDRIWCDPAELKISTKKQKNIWSVWNGPMGVRAVNEARVEMERRALSEKKVRHVLEAMVFNHLELTKDPTGQPLGNSDIFYVPRRLQEDFLLLTEIFRRHEVYLEITVPHVLYGMDSLSNISRIEGQYLFQERPTFYKHYSESDVYLHPVKFGMALNTAAHMNFFCDTFFPRLVQNA